LFFIQKYIKLNLFFHEVSKKHHIFRAKNKWTKDLEKITNKAVFTEEFKEIGFIKEKNLKKLVLLKRSLAQ